MARRTLSVLACLVVCLYLGGASIASAAGPGPARAAASAPAKAFDDGVDPAERGAVKGTLNYNEKREYPYAMLVFLVVITPVALVAIRRWTPRMEDGDA
jgi:hypothetical protein